MLQPQPASGGNILQAQPTSSQPQLQMEQPARPQEKVSAVVHAGIELLAGPLVMELTILSLEFELVLSVVVAGLQGNNSTEPCHC